MSRKTERLVNLTIALLATKRYLTKSEIFRTIEGYEGSAESKERMFERDKDDLRNLGIDIEVGSFDPLFEDEAGYRIKPDNYQFQLGEISSQEVSLLSLAAEAWRGAALAGSAQTALRKLHAIGIKTDLDSLPELAPHVNNRDRNLQIAISAITSKKVISFQYLSEDLQLQNRKVAPYAVASKYGYWYLYGEDRDKNSLRSFRLDRISGEIDEEGRSSAYEIPPDFQIRNHMLASEESATALIYLRSGRANNLRNRSKASENGKKIAGWDLVELTFRDRERLIEELLWYGDDVVLSQPQDIRDEIISRLKSAVTAHG